MTVADPTPPVVPADAAERVERYARAIAAADDEDVTEGWTEYERRAQAAIAVADAEVAERAATRQQDAAGTMATRVEGASGFWNGATLNQKGEVK